MTAATVRAALAEFFTEADIPGLNKVFPGPPYWADGGDWKLNLQHGSGSVGALHLVEQKESRITVPAVIGGQKARDFTVGLMVFFQYMLPSGTLTPDSDESAWVEPLDVILDGIVARIESDPNCGAPDVIFEAGQAPEGIKIVRDLPRRMPGKVVSWNVVEFIVTEIVVA